jgi:SAM-dependent methyltransferase
MSTLTQSSSIKEVLEKDRSGFLSVLQRHIEGRKLDTTGALLVLGASEGDELVLRKAGWFSITLSNFALADSLKSGDVSYLELDAEDIALPDESFECVAAYEVLHHCRSPHRALCEMLRVSRRYVIFQEPNDSALYALLRRLGRLSPFETAAVVANGFVAGGVRNSAVPNHIYRWNHGTARQTAMSFVPDRIIRVHSYPYWELNQTDFELSLKLESPLGFLIKAFGGPRRFRKFLRLAQRTLNGLPVSRHIGNQFFCCIEKTEQLHEWLQRSGNEVVFNKSWPHKEGS